MTSAKDTGNSLPPSAQGHGSNNGMKTETKESFMESRNKYTPNHDDVLPFGRKDVVGYNQSITN